MNPHHRFLEMLFLIACVIQDCRTYEPEISFEDFLKAEHEKYIAITEDVIYLLIDLGNTTAGFPKINRKEYIVFFHAAFFEVKKAHDMIVRHYQLRGELKEIFNEDSTDPSLTELDRAKKVMSHSILFIDSNQPTGQVGYRYIYSQFIDKRARSYIFIEQTRYFFYMIKCLLIEYGTFDGLVVIVNAAGFSWSHVNQFNRNLLGPIITLIQHAPPTRIKKIVILNTNLAVQIAYGMIKWAIANDLRQKIVLYGEKSTKVYDGDGGVPRTLMPNNVYHGGAGPSHQDQALRTYELMRKLHNRYGPNTVDIVREIPILDDDNN